MTTPVSLYTRKKDLSGKTLRVIVWGRNEYNGSVMRNAKSFDSLDDDPSFYFENGQLHFIHIFNPNGSFRYFKTMSRHYVFDSGGVCVSHPKKRFLNRGDWRQADRPGLPYAEIILQD